MVIAAPDTERAREQVQSLLRKSGIDGDLPAGRTDFLLGASSAAALGFQRELLQVMPVRLYTLRPLMKEEPCAAAARKAAQITAELQGNKDLFYGLPATRALMTERLETFRGFTRACAAAREKARISLSISRGD